ncbi:hypothetical protein BH11PLA2_BH11PLA2_44950 [soil metagenome]
MRTAILFLLCTTPLFALDDPRLGGPRTYSTPSPNGQFLFVMIAPRPTDPHPNLVPEKEAHEKALYEKYVATGSGMYRNDGSTNPLFTVDWYSFRVFPADDGQHLVRYHGEFALTEGYPAGVRLSDAEVQKQAGAAAVSLYERDKVLKTYAVNDVVKNIESLPHSLQHLLWSAGGIMTADGKQFCLMTQDSRQVFFDLASGGIAYEREAGLGNARVWVVRVSLALVGLAAVAILIGFAWHGRLSTNIPNAVP